MDKLLKNTLIPIFSHKKVVHFLSCAKDYGHTIARFKNVETGVVLSYPIPKEEKYFEMELGLVDITGIEQGNYDIWTVNENETEESFPVNFTVLGDDKRNFVYKAFSVLREQPTKQIVDKVANRITEKTPLISTLFQKYTEEQDVNTKKAFALALKISIDLINKSTSNTSSLRFSIDKKAKEMTVDFTTVKVLDINMVTGTCTVRIPKDGKINLRHDADTIHMLIFIDRDEDSSMIAFDFTPNETIFADIWNKELEDVEHYQSVIEKTVNYPSSFMEFTEDEREVLSVINELLPVQQIVAAPKCLRSSVRIKVVIDHDDYLLLQGMGKPFYVSFREPELALDRDDCRHILITGETFEFYPPHLSMSKEDYLVWIEDDNGNIISSIALFAPDDALDEYDDYINNAFNVGVNKIGVYNHSLHFFPYILNRHSEHADVLQTAYKYMTSEGALSVPRLQNELLKKVCTEDNMYYFAELMRAVAEDTTLYGSYLIDFFSSPIRFKFKSNTLELPPRQSCVFVVDKFKVGGEHEQVVIPATVNAASQYRVDDCDYCLVRGFDTDSYKFSGFLTIDFIHNHFKPSVFKFLIEEVEVVI